MGVRDNIEFSTALSAKLRNEHIKCNSQKITRAKEQSKHFVYLLF